MHELMLGYAPPNQHIDSYTRLFITSWHVVKKESDTTLIFCLLFYEPWANRLGHRSYFHVHAPQPWNLIFNKDDVMKPTPKSRFDSTSGWNMLLYHISDRYWGFFLLPAAPVSAAESEPMLAGSLNYPYHLTMESGQIWMGNWAVLHKQSTSVLILKTCL